MDSKETDRPDRPAPPDAVPDHAAWGATTQFGVAGTVLPSGSAAPRQPSAFDVCHVGVVLRAVLGVQLITGLGSLYLAAASSAWLAQWAQASLVSLPACLMWLLLACSLRPWLDRQPAMVQWLMATALGALCGGLARWQLQWLLAPLVDDAAALWPLVAPTLTGAALGAVGLYWLRARAHSELPAHVAARLDELQARIRPHFLFNTLNTAIALVQVDPQRAEAVLEDLAELFRQALVSPAARTTLGAEVDLARRYLGIEQLRFGDRLTVRWELEPGTQEALVPSLLLQPLVENAVRHGVEPAPQGGWIVIRARVQGDKVELSIRNSLPPAGQAQVRQGHGMALRNVRQRLMLMHDVESTFDAGVQHDTADRQPPVYVVKLAFPLRHGDHGWTR